MTHFRTRTVAFWLAVWTCSFWLGWFAASPTTRPVVRQLAQDQSLAATRPDMGAAGPRAYFSPHGGAQEAIVGAVTGAKSTVDVEMYLLSNPALIDSLISAAKRKVSVTVILDGGEERAANTPGATRLAQNGVMVFWNTSYTIFHDKIWLVDNSVTITGSFNGTVSAENKNAENLLVLHDSSMAAAYAADFKKHLAESKPFVPAPAPAVK